jgi:NodT family efflux transporter outer membrane factor (OMF) lipoprotein
MNLPGVRLLATVCALCTMGLSGCANFAGIHTQATLLAPVWMASALPPELSPAQFPQHDWWRRYQDARLDDLIATALARNPDIGVALARLRSAEADAAEADSARYPGLGFGASITHQRYSENDIYPPPFGGEVADSATTRATAQWTPDFFGAKRAALDAAIGESHAAEADTQAARVLLATDVAQAYFNLARLQAQQKLDQRLLVEREQTLKLVSQRVAAGLDTTLAQRQAEAEVPLLRVHQAQLDADVAQQRHALAALTGSEPTTTATLDARLPTVYPSAPPDELPADLLGHRADVVAARWRVERATENVRVAKTAFYPDINLSAFVGFDAIGLSHWLSAGSAVYGVRPAISLPLFDGGHLRAQLRQKTAEVDIAVEQYNARVLGALREVADALSSWRAVQVQIDQQSAVQLALDSASALAQQRYAAGLDNYLSVLVSEAAARQQQRTLLDLHAQLVSRDLALVRTLGGGYDATRLNPSPSLAGVRHE